MCVHDSMFVPFVLRNPNYDNL